MNKYIAFLRAINVGGHNVKMDHLKLLFEEMKYQNVETFIASGNVIFESDNFNTVNLEYKIEKQLFKSLGYDVASFIRTPDQLKKIIDYHPFSVEKYEMAAAYNIGFIKEPLENGSVEILNSLETDIDDFHSHKTEVYWLCKKRQSQSTFTGNVFERKLKIPVTFRGIKTLQKLVVKYSN